MGTVKKLYQDQLVGGSGSAGQEVYPVTSTLGVYDTDNNQLQGVLDKVTTNLGLFTCSTAAATAAKTVSASKFVLMEGGSVKIKFTYTNSADSPTLAIGTTEAKPIIFNGSAAGTSNSWGAGEIVEFFYDGTNWVGSSTSVSVSQNTSTGHTDITIGSTTTPVASVEEVSQLGQNIDELALYSQGVASLELHQGGITSSSKWGSINDSYKHIVIPVNPNDTVVVKGQTGKSIYSALVKTYSTPVNGETLDCSDAEGYDARFSIGSEKTITVPSDAHFLICCVIWNNESIPLSELFINGNDCLVSVNVRLDNEKASNGYVICATDADVADKTIANDNYKFGKNTRFIIKFNNSNVANDVTLNINSTGAKPFYLNNVRASSTNTWRGVCYMDVYTDGSSYYGRVISWKLNYGLFLGEPININTITKQIVLSYSSKLLDRENRRIDIASGTYNIDDTNIGSSSRCLLVWSKPIATFAIIEGTKYVPGDHIIIASLNLLSGSLTLNNLANIKYIHSMNAIRIDGVDIMNTPNRPINEDRFDSMPVNVAYSFIGDSGLPINTEEHFLTAARMGFNALKADIEITSDNVLICCHDTGFLIEHNSELDQDEITPVSSNYTSLIRELTWSEISNYVYKSGMNSATHYDAETLGHYAKVCTIEKYLQICKTFGMIPFVTVRNHYQSDVVPALFALLRKYNLVERCIINVNPETSDTVDAIRNQSSIAYICYTISNANGFNNDIVDYISSIKPAMVMIDYTWIADKTSVISYAISKGVRMGCYFVSEGGVYQSLVNQGFMAFQINRAIMDYKPMHLMFGVYFDSTNENPAQIKSIFSANSGKKFTADIEYVSADNAVYIKNISIEDTERTFVDGIMPIWMNRLPYSITAVGQKDNPYNALWVKYPSNSTIRNAIKIPVTSADRIRVCVNV